MSANSIDADQSPCCAASDQVLHCLHRQSAYFTAFVRLSAYFIAFVCLQKKPDESRTL